MTRLFELAETRRRSGCPMLTLVLPRELFTDNHNRIKCVYRQEGLQVLVERWRPHYNGIRPTANRATGSGSRQAETGPTRRVELMERYDGGGLVKAATVLDEFAARHEVRNLVCEPSAQGSVLVERKIVVA